MYLIFFWSVAPSQVVKTVYASPSRVNFQLNFEKASMFIVWMCYPFGVKWVLVGEIVICNDTVIVSRKWRQHLLIQIFVLQLMTLTPLSMQW